MMEVEDCPWEEMRLLADERKLGKKFKLTFVSVDIHV